MFGIKGFTSVSKPRRYQYVPRFYDPDKEAWEKKKDEYHAKGMDYGEGEYTPGSLVRRQHLHREMKREKVEADKMTYITRVVVFVLVAAIVYLLYRFFF